MSTDIQHLRREYSDGAVIGRKCLVQLCHFAADTGKSFNQVYLQTHIRKIQGRLDPGNTSAYNQDVFTHNQVPCAKKRIVKMTESFSAAC